MATYLRLLENCSNRADNAVEPCRTFREAVENDPWTAGTIFELALCDMFELVNWRYMSTDDLFALNIKRRLRPTYNDCKKCGKCYDDCRCCAVCRGVCECNHVGDCGVDACKKLEDGRFDIYQMKCHTRSRITASELGTFSLWLHKKAVNRAHLYTSAAAKYNRMDVVGDFLEALTCAEFTIDAIDQFIAKRVAEYRAAAQEEERPPFESLRDYQREMLTTCINVGNGCVINTFCGSGKSYVEYALCEHLLKNAGASVIVVCTSRLQIVEQLTSLFETLPCNVCTRVADLDMDDQNVFIMSHNAQRLNRLVDMLGKENISAVVLDESHHVTDQCSKELRKAIELSEADVYNFSATTARSDYRLSMEWGITNGYLVDYQIVIPHVEDDVPIKRGLAQILRIESHLMYVLAYCNSVEECKEFCVELNDEGITNTYITGETSLSDRDIVIAKFAAGEIRCLVSVYTLSEGFDCHEASVCLFVEPRHSRINIQQCIGRVLRKCPRIDKKMAHIMLPTLREDDLDKYLSKMSEWDTRVAREVRQGNFTRVSGVMSARDETHAASLIVEGVYDRYGQRIESMWDVKYKLLREYVTKHDSLPPQSYKCGEMNIGKWISSQRVAYKKNKLPQERVAQLEALPKWTWGNDAPGKKYTWSDNYNTLREYVTKHDSLPPYSYKCGEMNIGQWISKQRAAYKKNKLPQERVAQLEALRQWKWAAYDNTKKST